MHILITGGAGFIGSHLVRFCQAKGDDVTVLDNLTTGTLDHLSQSEYTFWESDIRDKAIADRITSGHFDAIVHLAAQTMVDASLRDVSFDADENIMGTLNILEAARKGGVKRIIFASTAAAYGDVTEKDTDSGRSSSRTDFFLWLIQNHRRALPGSLRQTLWSGICHLPFCQRLW